MHTYVVRLEFFGIHILGIYPMSCEKLKKIKVDPTVLSLQLYLDCRDQPVYSFTFTYPFPSVSNDLAIYL